MAKGSFVRISSLMSADLLVVYAFFVMQNYLTDVWGLSFTRAAAILNFWSGIRLILPGFFLWLVDASLGHLRMLVLSSISYSLGIMFVFMSTPPVLANSTGTCKHYEKECIGHAQRILFYTGMALVAVGMSGYKVSLRPFFENQLEDEPGKRYQGTKLFQIPGLIVVVISAVTGAIALPYIKPWFIRFLIPAICTVLGMILFFTGYTKYDTSFLGASPVTNVFRVFVACSTNMFKSFPSDDSKYRQDPNNRRKFTPTRCLRFLEKAALYDGRPEEEVNRWKVCTKAEVEEAKIAVRMIPMWMTFIICGMVSSIGNTYFVEQGNHMNRKIGKWNVPLQILLLLSETAKGTFERWADKLLYKEPDTTADVVKAPIEGTPPVVKVPIEGGRPAVGIGFAMILSVLCCITAARIEMKRLNVIRRDGLLDKPEDDIQMSLYWLLFQFFLLAGLNAFMQKSVIAFYALHAPKSMKDYLGHFARGVSGLGYLLNVLTVYAVGEVKPHWFQFTLNRSRLDNYYWFLQAALSAGNFAVFVPVASFYRYSRYQETETGQDPEEVYEGPSIADVSEENGGP